ncbi:hypothetical protein CFC21_041174 [Triticum aestivum]|uniref:ELMO domain-containing protein n=2 Tax=Triticum aestivum TaxID=4565 RepID=A0A3B6FLD6_WHEAT|nr:hypothetical protein CFC21_041174 [Triticum aestivum]
MTVDQLEELKALWFAFFPGTDLWGITSEQWKEMGWQGTDPSTDFRGGGFISLENLLFFAMIYLMSRNQQLLLPSILQSAFRIFADNYPSVPSLHRG